MRRLAVYAAVGGIVVAIVVLAVGELVPVSNAFSLSVESQGFTGSTVYHIFPAGAQVTSHWVTDNGGSVTFALVDAQGQALARGSGASGNFSFTSQGGSYGFQSYSWFIEVVNVQGSYAAPWLAGTS